MLVPRGPQGPGFPQFETSTATRLPSVRRFTVLLCCAGAAAARHGLRSPCSGLAWPALAWPGATCTALPMQSRAALRCPLPRPAPAVARRVPRCAVPTAVPCYTTFAAARAAAPSASAAPSTRQTAAGAYGRATVATDRHAVGDADMQSPWGRASREIGESKFVRLGKALAEGGAV